MSHTIRKQELNFYASTFSLKSEITTTDGNGNTTRIVDISFDEPNTPEVTTPPVINNKETTTPEKANLINAPKTIQHPSSSPYLWYSIIALVSVIIISAAAIIAILLLRSPHSHPHPHPNPGAPDKTFYQHPTSTTPKTEEKRLTTYRTDQTLTTSQTPSSTTTKFLTTTTPTTVLPSKPSPRTGQKHVKVYDLDHLSQIGNDTSSITLFSTTNHGTSWNWTAAPVILGAMSFTVNNMYNDEFTELRQIMKWLSYSLINLDIDASFAKHQCNSTLSAAAITSFGIPNEIVMPHVDKMEIRNLNKCFCERWARNFNLPGLKEVEVFGTDEQMKYQRYIPYLFKKNPHFKMKMCDKNCSS